MGKITNSRWFRRLLYLLSFYGIEIILFLSSLSLVILVSYMIFNYIKKCQ